MKINQFYFLILLFCVVLSSCNEDSPEYSNEKDLLLEELSESVSLIKNGSSEVLGGLNLNSIESSDNRYDYAGRNFSILQGKLTKDNVYRKRSLYSLNSENEIEFEDIFEGRVIPHYESIGYSKEEVELVFSNTQKVTERVEVESNNLGYIDYLVDDGLMGALEGEIAKIYLEQFLKDKDPKTFLATTKYFEKTVNSTDLLSDLSKRNLLSIMSVAKAFKYTDFSSDLGLTAKNDVSSSSSFQLISYEQDNLEVVCAGNVIIYMVGGAVTGNGVGAAVGLLFGLWEDYKAGCMD